MQTARRVPGIVPALVIALCVIPVGAAQAQMDPIVTDDVAASTVMLTALVTKTENGQTEDYRNCFLGSGSVLSEDARIILTNSHVVSGRDLADSFAESEEAELIAENPGRDVAIHVEEIAVWVVDHAEASPDRRYRAEVVKNDPILDLAVLEITGDSPGRDHDRPLRRPHLDLGSSSGVGAVVLFGYPNLSPVSTDDPGCVSVPVNQSIQRFPGSMSGRLGSDDLGLLTVQASAAPGMSGGSAVDSDGRLIGVPAEVRQMAADGLVEVIPIERAHDLLQEFISLEDSTPEPTNTPVPPTPTPAQSPSPTPTPTPTPSPTPTPTPTPTPPPSPTPSPTPLSPTSTPTPTATRDLGSLLPGVPPLPHGTCFRIEDDGARSIEDVAQRLGTVDASAQLAGWGWQANAYAIFACDGPPAGGAGYLDLDIHRFADAASARQAVDSFALARAADNDMLAFVAPPAIGDYAVALAGPATNGQDFSVYASRDSLFVRVIGVSPSGSPAADVEAVAQAVLAAEQTPQASTTLPQSAPGLLASSFLPASPAVAHADCFTVAAQGAFTYDDVASALLETGMPMSEIEGAGWQDGAYVVFICADPPPGSSTQIDIVIHRFVHPQSAWNLLPFITDAYVPGANEARSCDSPEDLVICVTGRALSGSPQSDVQNVLQQLLDTSP